MQKKLPKLLYLCPMCIKHPFMRSAVAGWLLAIFLFAIAPHELVHDVLSHHQDTVDVYHSDVEVSSHHIHCGFLQVKHAPFTSVYLTFLPAVSFQYIHFYTPGRTFYSVRTLFHFQLRGPPLMS